jgi:hypothetical protein
VFDTASVTRSDISGRSANTVVQFLQNIILRDPCDLPLKSNNGGVFPVFGKRKFHGWSTVNYIYIFFLTFETI